jgi:hypothetical protein
MIRTAIREEQAHFRHRNVAKLLFVHMLGEFFLCFGLNRKLEDSKQERMILNWICLAWSLFITKSYCSLQSG